MNYYGRRRYRNYSRASRAYSRRSRFTSSSLRRASGNYRAALQQRDQTSVNLSIPAEIKVNSTLIQIADNWKPVNERAITIPNGGVYVLNIFDLMRKSTFYKSYANMYDQVKIDRIRVKLTPSTFTQTSGQNYLSYTVVTAWDRTGLSDEQLAWNILGPNQDNGIGAAKIGSNGAQAYGLYCLLTGQDISTYSSAVTKPVSTGANSSIIRTLYPRTTQEKGFYVNTADIDEWYEGIGTNNQWYGIENARAIDGLSTNVANQGGTVSNVPVYKAIDVVSTNAVHRNPCFVGESPTIPWKPTLLIGLMNSGKITLDGGTEVYPSMGFYVEADIGVSFRGLRKADIVNVKTVSGIDLPVQATLPQEAVKVQSINQILPPFVITDVDDEGNDVDIASIDINPVRALEVYEFPIPIENNSNRIILPAPNGMLMKQIAFSVDVQPPSTSLKQTIRYISLAINRPSAGTLDLNETIFNIAEQNVQYTIPLGRTLIILYPEEGDANGNRILFKAVGNPSTGESALSYSVSAGYLYHEVNYDIGNWVYFFTGSQTSPNRLLNFATRPVNNGAYQGLRVVDDVYIYKHAINYPDIIVTA